MGEEEKQEAQAQEAQAKEAAPAAAGEVISDDEFTSMLGESFGSFKNLAALMPSFKTPDGDLVRGVEWLDPKKDFQRKEFLTKKNFEGQRKLLALRLNKWIEYLAGEDAPDTTRKKLSEDSAKLEANLRKNMTKVHSQSRELETTYRAIDKFFANAQQEPDEKVNAYFANAGIEELTDPDDKEKFEQLGTAIADLYREWSIKECFSMACVPGYMGSVENIDTFARQLGLSNKLHIMTDLPNFESVDEVMEMLDDPTYANMIGTDSYKQYVSVFANYLLARNANEYEDDDMWVPPSASVAGMMYKSDLTVGMQQPSAGFKYGKIADAKYIRFRANQPDASKINEKGVNPLVSFEGSAVAMGSSTLSTQETFNVYSIRRTYDYVYKTLRNYLNKQTFTVIDQKMIDTLRSDIDKFMRAISGGDNILQDYNVEIFADEAMRKAQEVDIKVALNPKYPARTFNIEFEAWDADNQTNVKDK
ncbi:MAG: type VI secretion system contractile sheath protein TssC [candidate division Zixibacteria bacterium]|nr:type VI secretion system contractile sheath protein TssC [candidate division Zixibacteria bacterium]